MSAMELGQVGKGKKMDLMFLSLYLFIPVKIFYYKTLTYSFLNVSDLVY